jgi:CheY-like chemotaxis protein
MEGGPIMGSSPVVLVVEDEWFLRDCIAAHLRAARWHVIEARSGEAAIELLKERKHVDVLFTDIQLGGAVDGWDVGVTFRKVLPEIPVIYTSGYARPSALAVPESLFISKPYEPDAVVEACRKLTNGGA